MIGRWTLNKDNVLVFVDGKGRLLGATYPAGLGTYENPWKIVVYSRQRHVLGVEISQRAAQRRIEDFWRDHG